MLVIKQLFTFFKVYCSIRKLRRKWSVVNTAPGVLVALSYINPSLMFFVGKAGAYPSGTCWRTTLKGQSTSLCGTTSFHRKLFHQLNIWWTQQIIGQQLIELPATFYTIPVDQKSVGQMVFDQMMCNSLCLCHVWSWGFVLHPRFQPCPQIID